MRQTIGDESRDGDLTVTGDVVANGETLATVSSVELKADLSVAVEGKTADYTFVLADAGKLITVNSASAETVTIPPSASVAFPTGTLIGVAALGAGVVDIQGGSGVTVNSLSGSAPSLSGQYAAAQCHKIDTDTWLVVGSIA